MYKKGRIHRLRNASLTFRSALSVDCVLNSPDLTVLEGFDAFEIPVKNGTLGGVSSLLWVPLTYEGTNDKNKFFSDFLFLQRAGYRGLVSKNLELQLYTVQPDSF